MGDIFRQPFEELPPKVIIFRILIFTMIKAFINFRDQISNAGLDKHDLGREAIRVRLLNQLIAIAFITSSLALVTYLLFDDNIVIVFTTLVNMVMEATALALSYFRRHKLARLVSLVLFPTAIAIHVVILGGNFGEANIFAALGFAAFIIFGGQRWLQFGSVVYIVLLFSLSKYLSIANLDPEAIVTNPYDEIITFPAILIALGFVILLYQREMARYEEEQHRLFDELAAKNRELLQINGELEEFTYIASHDLKTPLRSIGNFLGLMELNIKRKRFDELGNNLHIARQGVSQMYALVNDILEYKKMSQQDRSLEVVDLPAVFRQVVAALAARIEEKQARVSSDPLPSLLGNAHEIFVLFLNLIENGLKYNQSEQPSVHVSSCISESGLFLTFQDNGIGINPAYHELIFRFFSRLYPSDQYEGTGIGLGLCKKIMHNYQGEIRVESGEGAGASLILSFPISVLVADSTAGA